MSSAVVSTSAALGRPFLFDDDAEPEVSCHPERSGKYAKRISRGVEEPALSLPKGSLPSPDPRLASILPASQLEIRPAPEMASSGIPDLDALTGGLPRGCLTEICGPASSGRTTILLTALAAATRRGEYCALLDASDSLDPHSVEAAGVDLGRLLWVRCGKDSAGQSKKSAGAPPLSRTLRQGGDFDFLPQDPSPLDFQQSKVESPRCEENASLEKSPRYTRQSEHCLEQVLRSTDLLLESGGFGLIVLDLADLPLQSARRIPLTTWFRFRRAVEHKPTILLAIEQQPIAGNCSTLLLRLEAAKRCKNAAHGASRGSGVKNKQALEERKIDHEQSITHDQTIPPTHAHLLTGLHINAELIRSRLDRKPARSVAFATKTAWAG